MKWISTSKLIGFISGMLGVLFLVPSVLAGSHKEHPYRYSVVDMPVSLAIGTVRTPAFPVAPHWYWIMIQVEKPLPFQQMQCMMGVTANPFESKNCTSNDPLLRADWNVWNEGHIVSSGSSTTKAAASYTKRYIFKFLGDFAGEAGKKYVVEVKFTKDGTPLNIANPHLIVVQQGNE
ncbi:MAG TPA: hypothetical protein VGK24_06295 [Candidatus Angelobacter sp.]|jgi:hypothetical protein